MDKTNSTNTSKKFLLKQKKRIGYGPLAAVVVVLLTYFLSQIVAAVIVGAAAPLFGYDAETVLNNLDSSTGVQFIYIAIVEAITLYVLWTFMRRRNVSLKDIGLGRYPALKDVGPALIVGLVYFGVLILITALVQAYVPSVNVEQEQQLGFENAVVPGQLLLVFISLVILPPIVEEIMIRGFLYTGLRAKFTKIISAIIASLLFGLAHLQLGSGAPPLWIAAIDTALLSFFLIYLREKTGALWSGILVHGIKNGLAFTVLFVAT